MREPISLSLRYRERADECRRLAAMAAPSEICNHYAQIAEHYLALAEAEEKVAGRFQPLIE